MNPIKLLFSRQAREQAKRQQFEKLLSEAVSKTSTWGRLFETGQRMGFFGETVQQPYQQIASVYKAIKAICDNIPQADLELYRKSDGEETEDPALDGLLANPNPLQTGYDFLQEWVGFYALYGEGFILKEITTVGEMAGTRLPLSLTVLNPKFIEPRFERDNQGVQRVVGWRYYPTNTIYPIQTIVHTKDFNPYNNVRGFSPLLPIKDEIEIDQSTLDFNNAFFKNDGTAGYILSTDKTLTQDQRDRLMEYWKKTHQGAKKAFNVDIFEGGLKPEVVGSSHKEMEFVEQKKLMREEILSIWKAPKALFSITDDLNYATHIGQMKVFWYYSLMPIMRKFEDSFNKHIVTPYNNQIYFAFDYSNVPAFGEDFKEKVGVAQQLFAIGVPLNDINEKLDLGFDKYSWGDSWWINPFLTPAENAGIESAPNLSAPASEGEEEEPEKEPEKSIKQEKDIAPIRRDPKQLAILKAFGRSLFDIETKFEKKISRYFFNLRKAVLSTPDQLLAEGKLAIDWQVQNQELIKLVTPIMEMAIRAGVDIGQGALGKKTLADDILNGRITSLLTLRLDKITGINLTMQKEINKAMVKSITEGASSTDITRPLVDIIRENCKETFNRAGVRAKLIARTESAGAINGGSLLYYSAEGVPKKRWVTAHDEFVRASHVKCEQQGAIEIDKKFSNGLEYPSDQLNGDAGEVCNCRCSLVPVED